MRTHRHLSEAQIEKRRRTALEYYRRNKAAVLGAQKARRATETYREGQRSRYKLKRHQGPNALEFRRVYEKLRKTVSKGYGLPVYTTDWSAVFGGSPEDFRMRIEAVMTEGMTWANYGEVWEVNLRFKKTGGTVSVDGITAFKRTECNT